MTDPEINWYGLRELGFTAKSLGLTGHPIRDQVLIESTAIRIEHASHEGGLGTFGHFRNFVDLTWNHPNSPSMKRCIWNPWSNRMFLKMCTERELAVAGSASAGKSDPASLYGVVRYVTDPSHTLVLVMSTTIKEAKKRIWKSLLEYWEAIPGLPGRLLKATNEIKGLNYRGDGYGESSGIYLMAAEQGSEREAVNKLIGIKAPRTGTPGMTFEELIRLPQYSDLARHAEEEVLRDLVPRLHNLSADRIGRLILIIDEMTGISEAVLTALNTNLKPGNVGHFQIIGLANPDDPYDTFGQFAKPRGGFDKVDLIKDEEWETSTGGTCIRFNAEKNPRITEKDERCSWMPREEDIKLLAETYGRESRYYYRMVLGTWSLTGAGHGVYSPADIEMSGAKTDTVTWGMVPPIRVCYLDPSFTAGGDLAICTFGKLGRDAQGNQILHVEEQVAIHVDPNDKEVPVNFQIVKKWRKMCEDRKILPTCAAYDRSGGGTPFGDIVSVAWSPHVFGITSGGKPSGRVVPGEKDSATGNPLLARDKFENKATEIWYGAHPFFRTGQIAGVTDELAKELCTRRTGTRGRKEIIEDKLSYKARERKSPDKSDSFLGLIEFCREKHGFVCGEAAIIRKNQSSTETGMQSWKQFQNRVRSRFKRRGLDKPDDR